MNNCYICNEMAKGVACIDKVVYFLCREHLLNLGSSNGRTTVSETAKSGSIPDLKALIFETWVDFE